jgi:flagellar biosynthesis/type III secretory pathway protein FliH
MTKSTISASNTQPHDFRSRPFAAKSATTDQYHPESCSLFQPLFHCGAEGDAAPADKTRKDPALRIEEARRNGLHNGLKSGCEEACAMARASLRPSLRALVQRMQDLGLQNEQIKEHGSANILELGMAIVRQILGTDSAMSLSQLASLKANLAEAMARANRLSFAIHPDDLSEIQAFAAADNLPWPSDPAIDIQADGALKPGELRIQDPASSDQSLEIHLKEGLAVFFSTYGQQTP